MTATQMFCELGYSKEKTENFIKFYQVRGMDTTKCIYFDLRNKTFYIETYWVEIDIDMPTFKAIQQKLIELGWLE